MEVREVQPEKAFLPIEDTLSGMTIEVRVEQPEKAKSPMEVTLSGMVMEARKVQFSKADWPMKTSEYPDIGSLSGRVDGVPGDRSTETTVRFVLL